MQVNLEVDATLMTWGVSLCHCNKVINNIIIAMQLVYVALQGISWHTHQFHLLLDLASLGNCMFSKVQDWKKYNFAKVKNCQFYKMQLWMNAQECRTFTATCMHDSCTCKSIACLMCIMLAEALHLNRVLVLESVNDLGVGEGTWLCHYINWKPPWHT